VHDKACPPDVCEGIGDPVPQFSPPKWSAGVVEDPEQSSPLSSIRLGKEELTKRTACELIEEGKFSKPEFLWQYSIIIVLLELTYMTDSQKE